LTTFIDHRQRKTTVSQASPKVGTNHHRQPRRLLENPSGRAGTGAANKTHSETSTTRPFEPRNLHPEPDPIRDADQ